MATRCDRGLSRRCSFSIFCLSASHENEKKTNKQTHKQNKTEKPKGNWFISLNEERPLGYRRRPHQTPFIGLWMPRIATRSIGTTARSCQLGRCGMKMGHFFQRLCDILRSRNGNEWPAVDVGTVWNENGTLFSLNGNFSGHFTVRHGNEWNGTPPKIETLNVCSLDNISSTNPILLSEIR